MQPLQRLLRGLLELAVAAVFCGVPVALAKGVLHPILDHQLIAYPAVASAVGRTSILVACLVGYWAFARIFERRQPAELVPHWRTLLLGGLSGSLLIGTTLGVLFASGCSRFVSYRGVDQSLGIIGVILVAATLEELVFRGLLFRLLEKQLGTLWAVVTGAVTFGALHLANPGVVGVTFVSVTVLGILWTGVFVLTRSLWATALHHAAWNLTIFVSGLPLSGQEAWRSLSPMESTTSGPVLLTGGAFGPEDSLVSIALTLVACVVLFTLAARRLHAQNQ